MELIIFITFLFLLLAISYFANEWQKRKGRCVQEEYNEEIKTLKKLSECSLLIENIKSVNPGDFTNLLKYHQQAWNKGIQPPSLAQSKRGYFRDKIPNLSFETIFLGGIDDLNVRTVIDWLDETDPIGENEYKRNPEWTKCTLVWNQYKNILLGSIGAYKQTLLKELENFAIE